MTISEFFADLDLLTNNKFAGVSNSIKIRLLNRALLNTWDSIKYFSPDYGSSDASLAVVDGTCDLPSDFNTDCTGDFIVYCDSERLSIVPSDSYRVYKNTIRFNANINASYYIEYTPTVPQYETVADTFNQTDVRSFEVLQSELEYLRDVQLYQGNNTGQAQSSRFRTNEIA